MDYIGLLITITGVLVLSVISPGPNFAIVTSVAVSVSRRAGVMTGLGLASASFTWALLTIVGLGLIITNSVWIYWAIKLAGAVYLLWLGAKMIIGARKPPKLASMAAGVSGWAMARKGFLVSMTNPKAIAFYGSIFVTLVPADAPTWLYVTIVMIAAGVSASWYCNLALLFSNNRVRNTFLRAKTAIEVTIGLLLMWLGGHLLVTR